MLNSSPSDREPKLRGGAAAFTASVTALTLVMPGCGSTSPLVKPEDKVRENETKVSKDVVPVAATPEQLLQQCLDRVAGVQRQAETAAELAIGTAGRFRPQPPISRSDLYGFERESHLRACTPAEQVERCATREEQDIFVEDCVQQESRCSALKDPPPARGPMSVPALISACAAELQRASARLELIRLVGSKMGAAFEKENRAAATRLKGAEQRLRR